MLAFLPVIAISRLDGQQAPSMTRKASSPQTDRLDAQIAGRFAWLALATRRRVDADNTPINRRLTTLGLCAHETSNY